MNKIKSFDSSHKLLYLIATPIGNLGEFSPRALEIIQEMDYIAAEDTRNSRDLLAKFNISKPFISLREHNEIEASEKVIEDILNGKKVAYMSDAGYPGISDPGNILVKIANENNVAVSVISGASAFINALVSSNLDTNHFYFHGFLPAKKVDAVKELEETKDKKETLIFYESPHRIEDTLKTLFEVLGDRKIVLHRELTKLNEEKIYGTISELLTLDFNQIKGEIVLVVEGNKVEEVIHKDEIINFVNLLTQKGLSQKDAIEVASTTLKVKKNYIKDLFM